MWYLADERIFVQKFETNQKQIIPQLQPLFGGTIYQFYGYESEKIKLSALVVGKDYVDHLLSLTTSGDGFQLTSPIGVLGNYIVENAKYDWMPTVYQTIRPEMDCLTPVFTVELELLKE